MIRFCHKKVHYITVDVLNREKVKNYLLDGYEGEQICVIDKKEKFIGIIASELIDQNNSLDFIKKEYVILDENIWENGRKYFMSCQNDSESIQMLPVLNKELHFICFAYQDDEANRELRMLDELADDKNMLDFRDLYPQYNSVWVQGCNELAYYFAKYLRNEGVFVHLSGQFWKEFNIWKETSVLREEDELYGSVFTVYAEGQRSGQGTAELWRSVSAEFECINKIYEENIFKGRISDAKSSFKDIIRNSLIGKKIGILGTGIDALNAYDLLLEYGVDICCFISDEMNMQKICFGKSVLNKLEALECGIEIIIEAASKNSAWGFGKTDYYHYLGYRRNRDFFLLQDYIEISDNGLINVFEHVLKYSIGRLVLVGEPRLCLRLNQMIEAQAIERKQAGAVVYCDVLGAFTEEKVSMKQIMKNDLGEKDICLLLFPENYGRSYRVTMVQKYKEALRKFKATDFVDYPFDNVAYIEHEEILGDNMKPAFKVGKILIGSINGFSGCAFFRGILDDHPDILSMHGNYVGCNLFSVCTRLAAEKSDNILRLFWKIHDEESEGYYNTGITGFPDRDAFNHSMNSMLQVKNTYTSQELFVMIHIAYAKMWGKEIKDISKMMIYWEPHDVPRNIIENYAVWLDKACTVGYIINIVRNAYIRAGSFLRWAAWAVWPTKERKMQMILEYPNEEKKDFAGWKRIIMKFEDLKCNPEQELRSFCEVTGIAWSDTMLDVRTQTSYGSATGFDLTPVYRTYEEYFSTFDRFRISLITGAWQKEYKYPYVSSLEFSRQELQDIFSKKFRFEKEWTFASDKEKILYLKRRQKLIDDHLWINRKKEMNMQ